MGRVKNQGIDRSFSLGGRASDRARGCAHAKLTTLSEILEQPISPEWQ
jgi:hypothetical protein